MKVEVKNKPWKHFIIDDVFSKEDYQTLKDFPRLDSGYENITGFRDAIDNRVFLNDKFVSENSNFRSILKTLNNTDIFKKIFGVDLKNCSLRPELIDDRYPFFHEVHCDHPDKVLTLLIYIDKDDKQNLASDLYVDKNTHHTKLKWKDNGGIGWTIEPNDNKWHGFKPMKYKGVRRILICNWVKNSVWRNDSQLYKDFRSRPFLFNPKKWNKLNDLERNNKYDEYMDWLGGINPMNNYTDNVNSLKPNDEDNLYKKLKAYILLCRRYRDDRGYYNPSGVYIRTFDEGSVRGITKNITKKEIRLHLDNLKILVNDNFNEIVNNLIMTKWYVSIAMCFIDLGTEEEKLYLKKLFSQMTLDRLDFTRGRTLFTEDPIMNQKLINKTKNTKNIKQFLEIICQK